MFIDELDGTGRNTEGGFNLLMKAQKGLFKFLVDRFRINLDNGCHTAQLAAWMTAWVFDCQTGDKGTRICALNTSDIRSYCRRICLTD